MHIKLFLKNHRKSLIATVVLIILYVLLFEINFYFDPLRNKPDTIEVYKYGQKYEFHNGDKEYSDIYKLLHRYSKGTISTIPNTITASYKWSYGYLVQEYFDNGMAVRVSYNTIQKDSRFGSHGESYDTLVFLLNSSEHNYKQDVPDPEYSVPYATTGHNEGYYWVIINFPYPRSVERYVVNNIP